MATLTVDLTSVPTQKLKQNRNNFNALYYDVEFDIEISATSSLEYSVSIDGTRYGGVTASYT